jgi:hypothetical protein
MLYLTRVIEVGQNLEGILKIMHDDGLFGYPSIDMTLLSGTVP